MAEQQFGHLFAPRHLIAGRKTAAHILKKEGGGVVGDIGQRHIGIQELQGFALLGSGLQPLRIKKLFTYKRDTAVEGIVHFFTIRSIGNKMISVRC